MFIYPIFKSDLFLSLWIGRTTWVHQQKPEAPNRSLSRQLLLGVLPGRRFVDLTRELHDRESVLGQLSFHRPPGLCCYRTWHRAGPSDHPKLAVSPTRVPQGLSPPAPVFPDYRSENSQLHDNRGNFPTAGKQLRTFLKCDEDGKLKMIDDCSWMWNESASLNQWAT